MGKTTLYSTTEVFKCLGCCFVFRWYHLGRCCTRTEIFNEWISLKIASECEAGKDNQNFQVNSLRFIEWVMLTQYVIHSILGVWRCDMGHISSLQFEI